MLRKISTVAFAAAALSLLASPAAAWQDDSKAKTIKGVLTLFEGQQYDRQSYRVLKDNPNLPHDFLIGSIAIWPGEVWEVCDKPKYKGNCLTLTADETNIGKALIKSVRVITASE